MKKQKEIKTKKDLMNVLKKIPFSSKKQRNKITCALIGHSNIEETFFGRHYCGRCNETMGDALAGIYENKKAVIVGHNCKICRKNYKKLIWKDKLYVKNPFVLEGKK